MLNTETKAVEHQSHFKRLGKVKLGVKMRGKQPKCGKTHEHTDDCYSFYPKDVDYFVLPERWQKKLGDKPRALKIMLPFPELVQNFDIRAAMYRSNGSKFCHTDDDATAKRLVVATVANPKKGQTGQPATIEKSEYQDMVCPNEACEYRIGGKCLPRGGFEFMIPELYPEVGTLFMRVGSKVSRRQILGTLLDLEKICASRPNGMRGVRLVLERELVVFNIDTKGDGTLTRVEKWIPKISIDYLNLMKPDRELLLPIMAGQEFKIAEVSTAEDVNLDDDDGPPAEMSANTTTAVSVLPHDDRFPG